MSPSWLIGKGKESMTGLLKKLKTPFGFRIMLVNSIPENIFRSFTEESFSLALGCFAALI